MEAGHHALHRDLWSRGVQRVGPEIRANPCHTCLQLNKALEEQEKGDKNHRLFYLALPPSVYPQVSLGWTRCVSARLDTALSSGLICLAFPSSGYSQVSCCVKSCCASWPLGLPEGALADVACTQLDLHPSVQPR